MTISFLIPLLLLETTAPIPKVEHGSIHGKVVWAEKKIPPRRKIEAKNCPLPKEKQPLYSKSLVINPKNRGVKWTLVFLARLNKKGKADVNVKLPIHPTLQKIKEKKVWLDTPDCEFKPHIVCMRTGQHLVVENSAEVGHSINISGNGIDSPQD